MSGTAGAPAQAEGSDAGQGDRRRKKAMFDRVKAEAFQGAVQIESRPSRTALPDAPPRDSPPPPAVAAVAPERQAELAADVRGASDNRRPGAQRALHVSIPEAEWRHLDACRRELGTTMRTLVLCALRTAGFSISREVAGDRRIEAARRRAEEARLLRRIRDHAEGGRTAEEIGRLMIDAMRR